MNLPTPILDDRTFEELFGELRGRIPAYAPDWTDHNESDPGIVLLQLFAVLGESLLFRFNQIPDATKLAFLNLLGIRREPARAARALVTYTTTLLDGVAVDAGTELRAAGEVFEADGVVRAWPLEVLAAAKVATAAPEGSEARLAVSDALRALGAGPDAVALHYATQVLTSDPTGPTAAPLVLDRSVDGNLWLALLATEEAEDAEETEEARLPERLRRGAVCLGFVPDERISQPGVGGSAPAPRCAAGVGAGAGGPAGVGTVWRLWAGGLTEPAPGRPVGPAFLSLRLLGDSTGGLSAPGVVTLELPDGDWDLRRVAPDLDPDVAGAGGFPPPLDDPALERRVIAWVQAARPPGTARPFGPLTWVGVNAQAVTHGRKAGPELLGVGDGNPDQRFPLAYRPVREGSVVLQVEEGEGRWVPWDEVEDLAANGPRDRHFTVDLVGGEVRFATSGRVPQPAERIRVVVYHHGGGSAGNVAAGAINRAPDVAGAEVTNPLPARFGADAEPVPDALERIPAEVRRGNRAVTAEDFQELAGRVGGVGRAECLPAFHPDTPGLPAAGVVTVVVWPEAGPATPGAPVPDRGLLRDVCAYLDARRLITTELYVIAPTYRRIAVSVGLGVREGHPVDAVRRWVETILRQYLAPLPPDGPEGRGWPMGRRVYAPELEAAALQVEGVEYIEAVRLACWRDGAWEQVEPPAAVDLRPWEAPELTVVAVVEGAPPPPGEPPAPAPADGIPVPVRDLPEVC